jgi:hypothetical protein
MIKKLYGGAGFRVRPIFFAGLLIAVLALSGPVCAGQPGPAERGENGSSAQGTRIFFLAEEKVRTDGSVIAFFSDIEVEGSGDVYAFFSDITLLGDAEVHPLSSRILYLPGTETVIKPIFGSFFGNLFSAEGKQSSDGSEKGEFLFYSNRLPAYIQRVVFIAAGALLCLGALIAARGFVYQGGVILTAEPAKVIRNGIIGYIMGLALMIIMALTVILLPFVLLFGLLMSVMIILGQASLALLIGLVASRRLGKRFSALACFAVGILALGVLTGLPVLEIAAGYVFVPLLCMGITITSITDGVMRRRFYYAPFKSRREAAGRPQFNKKAQDIILGQENR